MMNLFQINREINRPDLTLVQGFAGLPTANISDAMANLNTMDSGIQALVSGAVFCGPACTVVTRSGDFVTILQGLDAAQGGDVLVISNQGAPDLALWGEITTTEAQRKGVAGLVVDGLVRDIAGIRRLGFPLFARGTTPRVTGRNSLGEVNVPVSCGGVVVHPGDIVVGDADGVVVVPQGSAKEILALTQDIVRYELELLALIQSGQSQVDRFQLDEQFQALRQAHLAGHNVG
jgi:regulator of RNase E activity RraA